MVVGLLVAGCSQDGLSSVPPGSKPAEGLVKSVAAAQPPSGDVTSASPSAANKWNGSQIQWHTVGTGLPEARRTGRPVLAVVKGDWCKQCKRYQGVFQDPQVVALSQHFVMVLADDRADTEVSQQWSVDGGYVPRTVFLSPGGELDTALIGKHPRYAHFINNRQPAELVNLMKRAMAQYGS